MKLLSISLLLLGMKASAVGDVRTSNIAKLSGLDTTTNDDVVLSGKITRDDSGTLAMGGNCTIILSECGNPRRGGTGSFCIQMFAGNEGRSFNIATAAVTSSYWGGVVNDQNYTSRLELDQDFIKIYTNGPSANSPLSNRLKYTLNFKTREYILYPYPSGNNSEFVVTGQPLGCTID